MKFIITIIKSRPLNLFHLLKTIEKLVKIASLKRNFKAENFVTVLCMQQCILHTVKSDKVQFGKVCFSLKKGINKTNVF